MPSDIEPLLYNIAQTAQLLGIGRDAVYELIKRDELPHVRLGERTVRVPRPLLEEWIRSRARGGRS